MNINLKSTFAFIVMLIVINKVNAQFPSLTSAVISNVTNKKVDQNKKFELTLKLNRFVNTGIVSTRYKLPHDTAEVEIYAIFINQISGKILKVNAFYDENTTENDPTPCQWGSNQKPNNITSTTTLFSSAISTNQTWNIRSCFIDTGIWNYNIYARDKYSPAGFTILNTDTIYVLPNINEKGKLYISEANHTYLTFKNGEICFINGVNEFWAENQNIFMCKMRNSIDKMSQNNINMFRLFIASCSDWQFIANLNIPTTSQGEFRSTVFNSKNAKMIDMILEYARSKNIYVQFCVQSPGLTGNLFNDNVYNITSNRHNTNLYNTPNVGEITNPWDYYNPNLLKGLKNYIRYITSRWGYATNLMGWEIGNEINGSGTSLNGVPIPNNFTYTVADFHASFKNYINYYDPFKHIVTTSTLPAMGRSFPIVGTNISDEQFRIFSKLDYTNLHLYFKSPVCSNYDNCIRNEEQEDALYKQTQDARNLQFLPTKKPTQIQEWGFGDDTCTPRIKKDYGMGAYDPWGFTHHNVINSSAFSGALGTALTFEMFANIQVKDLYYQYKGLGNFMKQFKVLGNPLYCKMERINFNNFNNSNCINTDFDRNGVRYYYMASYDTLVMGWCQDKRFGFSRLFWNDRNYLRTKENRFKPSIVNIDNVFTIKVPQKGHYKVNWFNSMEGVKEIDFTNTYRSYFDAITGDERISINFPKKLHDSYFADGFFTANYSCKPILEINLNNNNYSTINNLLPVRYSDNLKLKILKIESIDEVKIEIFRTDANGNSISTILTKNLLTSQLTDTNNLDLNNLYNATNPSSINLPMENNLTTFYKVVVTANNPNNIAYCGYNYINNTQYFKIDNCTSTSSFTLNNNNFSLNAPLTINHAEKIILKNANSKGYTGYRIILNEIDENGNHLNREYNALFTGQIYNIDLNKVVEIATNGSIKYIPSNGQNGFRLYKVYLVTFNSYAPANGCSNWVFSVDYIKVNCAAKSIFNVISSSEQNGFKQFYYADTILINANGSYGESGYRVIIQESDSNKNLFGTESNILFTTPINGFVDINKCYELATSYKYLLPNTNGSRYYRVKLVVVNNSDSGCTNWDESYDYIEIKSCHTFVDFKLNNFSSSNNINNPYIIDYASDLLLNAKDTKGETGYRILLKELNQNYLIINEYNILYNGQIDTIFDFNKWYNINVMNTKKYIPQNSINNSWQIQIVAFNSYNLQGCDNWVSKNLYFKIQNNLKSLSQLNNEDTIGKANSIKMTCSNIGTVLKPVLNNFNENKYRIQMEELEYATWQIPSAYITYYRQLPDTSGGISFIKKQYGETFEKKFNAPIDLEQFWLEKNGYKMDKTKVYKVSLITYDDKDSLIDSWRFSYYQCITAKKNSINETIDKSYGLNLNKKDIIILNNEIKNESSTKEDLESIELYPNPTNNNLYLTFNNVNPTELNINITNIEGKEIINNYEIQNIINKNNVVIDLSKFNSGTYFIKIITNNNIFVRKVIKL